MWSLFINILLYHVFVTDERRTVKTVINKSAITNKLFLSGVSTKYCTELQPSAIEIQDKNVFYCQITTIQAFKQQSVL